MAHIRNTITLTTIAGLILSMVPAVPTALAARPVANVSIGLDAPVSVLPGQQFDLRFTVHNFGPDSADDAEVEIQIPNDAAWASDLQSGECTERFRRVVCPLSAIASGADSLLIVPFRVDADADCTTSALRPETLRFRTEVDTDNSRDNDRRNNKSDTEPVVLCNEGDPLPGGNDPSPPPGVNRRACFDRVDNDGDGRIDFSSDAGCASMFDTSEADGPTEIDIGITGPDAIGQGEMLTYNIILSNNGPDAATSTLAILSRIDEPASAPPFVPEQSDGACAIVGNDIRCTTQNLRPGNQKMFALSFQLPTDIPCGTLIKKSAEASETPQGDPDPLNNQAFFTTIVQCDVPDLAIEKSADKEEAEPGDALMYTVTLTNEGPGDVQNASFSDQLPEGLSPQLPLDPHCIQEAGNEQNIICTFDVLPDDDSRMVSLPTMISEAFVCGGDIVNTATVSLTASEENDSADATTAITCPGGGGSSASSEASSEASQESSEASSESSESSETSSESSAVSSASSEASQESSEASSESTSSASSESSSSVPASASSSSSSAADLEVTVKATATTDTAVENEANIRLLRFDARATVRDILMTGVVFRAEDGDLLNAQNYALWADTDDDGSVDTLLQDAVSPVDSAVTFSGLAGGGQAILSGDVMVFEVHADVASSLVSDALRLGFDTAESVQFVQAEVVSDGSPLFGILLNGALHSGATSSQITVLTQPSTLWTIASQGDLYVTKDSTPLRARQLLGGALGEAILRLQLQAEHEPVDVTDLQFIVEEEPAVLSAGNPASSVDRLELYLSGESTPFAMATIGGCGSDDVPAPGATFCATMESRQLVIAEGTAVDVLVRPLMKSDTDGGSSGDAFRLRVGKLAEADDITGRGAVRARGDRSSNALSGNDEDDSAEGEIFIGTGIPGLNKDISGLYNDGVMAKITSVTNGNPDPNGTSIPSGVAPIARFTVTAAANANSQNGLNDADIDAMVLDIYSFNIAFDSEGFAVYDLANPSVKAPCTPAAANGSELTGDATGSFSVRCEDLSPILSIDQGSSLPVVLEANIVDAGETGFGQLGVMQVSFRQFSDRTLTVFGAGDGKSHLQWIDADASTSATFRWIEYPETVVKSTLYIN